MQRKQLRSLQSGGGGWSLVLGRGHSPKLSRRSAGPRRRERVSETRGEPQTVLMAASPSGLPQWCAANGSAEEGWEACPAKGKPCQAQARALLPQARDLSPCKQVGCGAWTGTARLHSPTPHHLCAFLTSNTHTSQVQTRRLLYTRSFLVSHEGGALLLWSLL